MLQKNLREYSIHFCTRKLLEVKSNARLWRTFWLALGELEATNQLLKDEYQTLQLALSSAEQKLVAAQKENDRLVCEILDMKERDVQVEKTYLIGPIKLIRGIIHRVLRYNS